MIDAFRFTAYHQLCPNEKCEKESKDLLELLRHLGRFMRLDDVQFGENPPDFIFHYQGKHIGVELTDMDPKKFEKNGYKLRGKFKAWQAATKPDVIPQKFDWGTYSLRESLAAFKAQLDVKRKDAEGWFDNFPERWLLMHVAKGSPFSEILGVKHQGEPGREKEVADFLAKSSHGVHSICQEIQPFDYVILFMQDDLLAFPLDRANPYKLPVLGDEIVERGAQASDSFLDWANNTSSVVKAVG